MNLYALTRGLTRTLTRTLLRPPSAGGADAYWANVSFLAPLAGADQATAYTEISSNAAIATFVNSAVIATAQSVFDASSGYFAQTNDNYISFPHTTAFDLGTAPWTIEFWIRHETAIQGTHGIMGHFNNVGDGNLGWHISKVASELGFFWSDEGTTNVFFKYVPWTPVIDQWYAVAVTRDSSDDLRLYVDGTQVGTTGNIATISGGSSVIWNAPQDMRLGEINHSAVALGLNGWIDNMRITKGVARYVDTSYTVPTEAFPTQ